MACALMPTNYFVVVLPNRQMKRVVRLTACNYERCDTRGPGVTVTEDLVLPWLQRTWCHCYRGPGVVMVTEDLVSWLQRTWCTAMRSWWGRPTTASCRWRRSTARAWGRRVSSWRGWGSTTSTTIWTPSSSAGIHLFLRAPLVFILSS